MNPEVKMAKNNFKNKITSIQRTFSIKDSGISNTT